MAFCMHAQNRQQVKTDEAVRAALCRINHTFLVDSGRNMTVFYKTNINGDTLLYEVVVDSSTVLLSGSKACIPVLGIYKTPHTPLIEMYDNLPCNIKDFIGNYLIQIETCFNNDTITLFNNNNWNRLINGEQEIRDRNSSVEPLVKTLWDQSGCNIGNDVGYEYYTPPDIEHGCNHCLVGCGAVAMGQVMNYWQYPVLNSKQNIQFDWCSMSEKLNTYDPLFEQNRDAVARLLADCGKVIGTIYGCNSSESNLLATLNGLIGFYGYCSSACHVKKNHYDILGPTAWMELLKDQLDNGYPMIYRGEGTGGHAFVCDGYNQDDEFHFNWGWAGSYDGFFQINDLTPGNNNYSSRQEAIIKLYPTSSIDICNTTLQLNDFYNSFYQEYPNSSLSPIDVTPLTMMTLTSASATSSSSWRTIPDGATATYQAHEEVHLRDGFTVERGADFTARIVPCPNCEENREAGSPETASAPSNTVPPETAIAHTQSTTDYQPPTTDLYPNPTSGEVTVGVDGEVQSIIIYTPMGLPVGGWRLLSIAPDRVTLDLSPLPAGTYILHIQTPVGVSTKRLVVAR